MSKKTDNWMVIMSVYLLAVLVVYLWLIYPALAKPKILKKTDVPSLSVSGIREADILFTSMGKEWVGYASEPDLTKYIFGQNESF